MNIKSGAVLLVVFITLRAQSNESLWSVRVSDTYSESARRLYDQWKSGKKNIKGAGMPMPLDLGAIPTEGDSTYIGIWARTEIHSGHEAVLRVLKNVAGYAAIYQDLETIHVEKSDKNDLIIDWRFRGPLGTSTEYQTVQTIDRFDAVRSGLLYGLKKRSDVSAADGFAFIQEIEGVSYYLSVDFFNARWGVAKLFGSTIWKKSCQGTAKATFAIRWLAEQEKRRVGSKKIEFSKASGFDSERVSRICSGMANRRKQKGFEKQILDILD